MSAVLQEIITLLTSGITQIAGGIGSGLQELVNAIFIDGTGSSPMLSDFGGVLIIFAGVSLAIGLCRWVVNWLTSFGN